MKLRIPGNVTRKTQRTVNIKFVPPQWMASVEKRLAPLAANPELVEQIVRRAMVETVLKAYQERFLARLPSAVATEREQRDTLYQTPSQKKFERRLRARRRIEAALASAETPDDFARVQELEGKYADLIRPRQRSENKLPPTNYRSVALEVMRLTTAAYGITKTAAPAGTMRFGVGSISALNRIQTPSATPQLKDGEPTSSRFTIFWRQLEFGTGVYASDKSVNAGSPYRLPSGGWWYGESEEYSLHIKGTRGVHALKNPATMMRYSEDYIRFNEVFARMLREALKAR